jgi:lipopolysaccharide export system ATP-binding protein
MSVLIAKGLQKTYKKRQVVRDFSIEVHAGQVVGLLGPNGAGKTTSFYMIVGLVAADSGQVLLNNQDLTHLPMHARAAVGIAYLPQEASIFRQLSVADNIRAILQLHSRDKQKMETRLDGLLQDLHITHIRDSMALSLSGGERRRVEIARALATDPKFILLDEPFAGVDPIAVMDIQTIIQFLKQRGIGVLITDHNVRETLGICDHAVIISDGAVLASGVPHDIIQNELVRKVYLGENFHF